MKKVQDYTADEVELLDALMDMVNQHCATSDPKDHTLDSGALSASAGAMRVLEKHGCFSVEGGGGRWLQGNLDWERLNLLQTLHRGSS